MTHPDQVLHWSLVIDLARLSGLWTVATLRPIRTGNLTPVAVVLERCSGDEQRLELRTRLAALASYFGKEKAVEGVGTVQGEAAVAGSGVVEEDEEATGEGGEDDGEEAATSKRRGAKDGNRGKGGHGKSGKGKGKGEGEGRGRGKEDGSGGAPQKLVSFTDSSFTTKVGYEAWARRAGGESTAGAGARGRGRQ